MGDDGRIYVPSIRVMDSPVRLGGTRAKITSQKQEILCDTVRILDPEGNPLEEISILDALVASGCVGSSRAPRPSRPGIR